MKRTIAASLPTARQAETLFGSSWTTWTNQPARAATSADATTPEIAFDRRWVESLLEQATAALRRECEQSDKTALFSAVKPFLENPTERVGYASLAAELGRTEGSLRTAIHRLRHRFGEIVRAAVAEALANPADVDFEIRSLFAALRWPPRHSCPVTIRHRYCCKRRTHPSCLAKGNARAAAPSCRPMVTNHQEPP